MIGAEWMARALELAARGRGRTSPNPMVGAVVVKDGRAAGEGFHARAGEPHAEIVALRRAGDEARGATLYVTLEPCAHHGKTPPCADAIIAAGVKKVTAAVSDPNPLVSGKGFERLRQAGIEVESGVLQKEASSLNEAFFKWIVTRLPFITLKYAMTLDGKIATASGDSKWITGEQSRKLAHEMRSASDAILVGLNTLLRDDPLLTARIPGGKNPIRVILDSKLKTPLDSNVMKSIAEAPVWIAAASKDEARGKKLEEAGARVLIFPGADGKVDVPALCRFLGENEVLSLLVEGGAQTHGSFLSARTADKLAVFISPKIAGGSGAKGPVENWSAPFMSEALQLHDVKTTPIGDELLVEGYLKI